MSFGSGLKLIFPPKLNLTLICRTHGSSFSIHCVNMECGAELNKLISSLFIARKTWRKKQSKGIKYHCTSSEFLTHAQFLWPNLNQTSANCSVR